MRSSPRRRTRELVLQGLYQQQLSGNAGEAIRLQLAESVGYSKSDTEYFAVLWTGVTRDYEALLERVAPHLDRRTQDLSPVERSIVVIGTWELEHQVDIPYRVVINEAVELAKSFGGTDGHKFVNGVLDKVAAELRGGEITAERSARAAPDVGTG
ncbi:MAG: transcription antitermination factor NusB [Betaproteobacteria bacterium]